MLLVSYLWGSLSPSYVVARWKKGIDLRRYGSGTVGGANVGEQVGRAWMIGVGSLDLLKGLLPPVLVRTWGFDWSIAVLVSLGTVIGHNWSLYLGFKGGRGMGTAIGVLFAWDFRLALILLIIIGIGWLTKQGATSSVVGLLLLAPSAWGMGDVAEIVWGCALLMLIIALKRLEANRLPLPQDPREKRGVLLRRLWMDRDVPADQPWQERGEIK